MSVVSERSARHRGPSSYKHSGSQSAVAGPVTRRPNRGGGGGGRGYPQSDMEPFLVPHFSVAGSEGVKMHVPQEDWAENTTVLTANTSEHSYGGDDRTEKTDVPMGRVAVRRCSRLLWLLLATVLTLVAVLSAPAMAALPVALHRLGYDWPLPKCEVDCQGEVLLLVLKTALLILAQWAMYVRRAAADLPRLYLARAAFALLVLFTLFAFWLFYTVRILLERHDNYAYVVSYSLSLLDALLYTHYISVIVLELRKSRKEYVIRITRDPDGMCRSLSIGMMSLQEAAVEVLRFYETAFPTFNAPLDKAMNTQGGGRMRAGMPNVNAGFKMYDIEGMGGGESISEVNARVLMEAAARRRIGGHVEMLQTEEEWDRRIKKRKYRLMTATEDAFAHVQGVQGTHNGKTLGEPMDSLTAAQNVFTFIARPLNKYLRLTKQQHLHPADQVTTYVEKCLSFRLSYRTFLQRFFSNTQPPTMSVGESKWSLVSDQSASSTATHGVYFLLRAHDGDGLQLMCHISSLPFYNITEQSPASVNKFALKISNESSV